MKCPLCKSKLNIKIDAFTCEEAVNGPYLKGAYRLVENQGTVHVNRGRRHGGSGCFVMATYEVVEPQPSDKVMRDNQRWSQWALAQAKAGEATCE